MSDFINAIYLWLSENYLSVYSTIAILTILYSMHYLITRDDQPQNTRDWIDLAFFTVAFCYLALDYLHNLDNFSNCQ